MNASIRLHYICVDIQKTRRAKALISVASPGIRIRKDDPYFSYFTRGKILFQTSYIDAKKADIITVFFQGLLRSEERRVGKDRRFWNCWYYCKNKQYIC